MGFSFGCGCCEVSGCIYGVSPVWGSCYSLGKSCPSVLTVSPFQWCKLPGQVVGIGAAVLQVARANPSSDLQHGNEELVWLLSSVQYRKQGISRAPVSLLSTPEHGQCAPN